MQHCADCGAELPNNALFCGHCGRKTTSEYALTTNVNDVPIEDIPVSSSALSMDLADSQNSTSEDGEELNQQTPALPSENDADEEEQTSYLASKNENEEQTPQESIEPTSSVQGDTDSELEVSTNQLLDDQSRYPQKQSVNQGAYNQYEPTQKSGTKPVSRCFLFSLTGLIVIVGLVFAMIGLFHLNLPGINGSSNASPNSNENEIINPGGSSLTASICLKTSTPSTSVASEGSTLILFSSSGCSTLIASKANSSCLLFSDTISSAHKFIFDASNATIETKSYHLVLGVGNYTGPNTYNNVQHISVGLSEGSTGRNFSWLYRSGSVTINNDQQSGTMDVNLLAVSSGDTLHVVGNWICGRQIKNT